MVCRRHPSKSLFVVDSSRNTEESTFMNSWVNHKRMTPESGSTKPTVSKFAKRGVWSTTWRGLHHPKSPLSLDVLILPEMTESEHKALLIMSRTRKNDPEIWIHQTNSSRNCLKAAWWMVWYRASISLAAIDGALVWGRGALGASCRAYNPETIFSRSGQCSKDSFSRFR